MQVNVSIGQNHHFALCEALLIYRSTEHQNGSFGNTFITHHEVNADNRAKQPTLGPAKTLTIEFVQSLVQALGGRVQAEFLPASVIARTERLIAWWTPRQKRPMFFGTTQGDMAGMNGATFPQPALVWLARITRSRSGAQGVSLPRGRYQALCGALLECVRHRECLPWIDAGAQCFHRRLHSPMGTELL